ncbi:hypothetical protein MDAP_000721 [Mitosporidium daphniae]|uniref:Peroxisomal biogenesis factor 11 n=1 Tax=Mitosporidium daphniae TaxID=1485682 RepID=A0A098VPL1_9MICR|nr:uncharacterized protein DI09_57p90 [Mitosporidium daphniae]KGG50754.1 hypothetical protein DI09_57p90 [Mitosporidium daphniae]|eukprot:XP_013237196.1 uncharacterized protein DI09_57p90 [Mitosporidium daphniae]
MPTGTSLATLAVLTEQTGGIDKIFRTAIYSIRLFAALTGREILPLLKLADVLSETRYVLRIFGSIFSIKDLFQANLKKRELIKALTMAVYYPLDALYLLAFKEIISINPKHQLEISQWSCRAWALYSIVELSELLGLWEQGRSPVLAIVQSAADMLLALNWSWDRFALSSPAVAGIGTISASLSLASAVSTANKGST